MSTLTTESKCQLTAAAAAITAAGFLTIAPPAQAHPMPPFPLAPACSQWGFNGNFSVRQSNGDTVRFNMNGPVASGPAIATGGLNGPLNGQVSGGIEANYVDFTINWTGDPRSLGRYTGFVDNDGSAHGDTYDAYGPATASWDSTVPLVCTIPAAAPAAAAPPAPTPAPQLSPAPNRLPLRVQVPQ